MISDKYKNIHKGKSGALFATGPSLNQFTPSLLDEPLGDVVKVGVNSFIYKDDVDLDYYFCAQDVAKEKDWKGKKHPHKSDDAPEILLKTPLFDKILERCGKVKVFCAYSTDGKRHHEFFNDEEIERMNAETYELDSRVGLKRFRKDISSGPLFNHSIVFPALQFLLYVGVTKIYLVGCDASGGKSYLMPETSAWKLALNGYKIPQWHDFKGFWKKEYPEVELVSVNPVGLKGMFRNNSREIYS